MNTFQESTRKNKKYMVNYNNKWIHFGDTCYEQYEDKALRLYKDQNHHDKIRRESYRKRARGIKNKDGKLTYLDKSSPNFYSYHFLW